jgi:hypothetical protein
MLDEREVAQHLLQSDELTRDKLCDCQADDFGYGTHVCSSGRQALHETNDYAHTFATVEHQQRISQPKSLRQLGS